MSSASNDRRLSEVMLDIIEQVSAQDNSGSHVLTEEFFNLLMQPEPTPGGDYVTENFLVPIRAGQLQEANVLADWLEDNNFEDKAQKIRELLTPEHLREVFQASRSEYTRYDANCVGASRLEFARKEICLEICRLFPSFMRSNAIDAINAFTRMKLREDGVGRRLFPARELPGSDIDIP
jgi:hypothetical protein